MKVLTSVKNKFVSFPVLAVMAASASAYADDDIPQIQLHGFATQGYSQVLSSTANSDMGVMDRGGTFLRDSILGINLSYTYNDKLSFYAQVTASGSDFFTGDELEYSAQADMIMLSYHPYDWLDVRIGRQIMPLWMVSEQIDVGLSYPWIRPPSEVYLLGPIKSASAVGADFMYNLTEDTKATVGFRYGNTPYETSSRSSYTDMDLNNLFIAYGLVDFNSIVKLRLAYGQAKVNLTLEDEPAVEQSSSLPYYALTTSNYDLADTFRFYSAGVTADYDNFFLMGEFAAALQTIHSNNPVSSGVYSATVSSGTQSQKSYYVTAGYRWDNWTPHLTYSEAYSNYEDMSFSNLSSFPYIGSQLAASFKAENPIFAPAYMRSVTVGLNYNILPQVVLKGQYEYIDVVSGAPQLGIGPLMNEGDKINSVSTAVSLVF